MAVFDQPPIVLKTKSENIDRTSSHEKKFDGNRVF